MAAPIVEMNGRWGGKLRNQNLDMTSGDDVTLQVTVLNIDASVKDITGATITWALAKRPRGTAVLTISGVITDASNGIFTVAVTGLGDYRGDWFHEIELTESGGAVGTVLRGWLQINEDIVNA